MLIIISTLSARGSFVVNQTHYDTLSISDIIRQMAPYYFVKPPANKSIYIEVLKDNYTEPYHENLTQILNKYRMNQNQSNYTSQYFYAAYQYINGVRLLFGINCSRDQLVGLASIQAASRFGCNEATMLLANGHRTGSLGLTHSPNLAVKYYKEIFSSWAAGVADSDSYQYNYNEYFVDLKLGTSGSQSALPKPQREHMIIDMIEEQDNRALYGNIIASGLLSSSYGFSKDKTMSARFALLGAQGSFKVKPDPKLNNFEAVLKYEEGKEEIISREPEKEKEKPEKTVDEGHIKKLTQKFKKLLFNQEENNEKELKINQLKQYSIPSNLKDKFKDYIDNYMVEDINILQFNGTFALTPDAFYDMSLKLAREALYKIYEEYSFFSIFKHLPKNATKDQVFDAVMWSNSTLLNHASRMFVDKTDTNIELQMLRQVNQFIDKGSDAYYEMLISAPQLTRSFVETCSRHGQDFGLVAYFLSSRTFIPKVVVDSRMNRNLARVYNFLTAYNGCHMGLTGLAFFALEGYRPVRNAALNQTTLLPLIPETTPKNVYYVRPEPRLALMGLDVASIAGSFEASYFESLILSHRLWELSPKLKDHSQFYYAPEFSSVGYQNIEQRPTVARMLAEHSSHAGHLGGSFLSALFWFEGYGTATKNQEIGINRMKRAAERVSVDWQVEDFASQADSDTDGFAQYLVHGLSGDQISLYNAFRFAGQSPDFKHVKICMNTRNGTERCEAGIKGVRRLLVELASFFSDEPAVAQQVSKICGEDADGCMLAIHGVDSHIDEISQKKHARFLRQQLTHNGELDAYLKLLVVDYLGNFDREFPVFENFDELMAAIDNNKLKTVTKAIFDELKKQSETAKFANLIFKCFYDDIDYNELKQLYGSCHSLQNILMHLSGHKRKEFETISTSVETSKDADRLINGNFENLNTLILRLTFSHPDKYLLKLLNLQERLAVTLCKNLTFNSSYKYYTRPQVQKMMRSFALEHVHFAYQKLNNVYTAVEDMKVTLNGHNFSGVIRPSLENIRSVFDFCSVEYNGDKMAAEWFLKVYIEFSLHLHIIVSGIIILSVLMFWDYWKAKKTDQQLHADNVVAQEDNNHVENIGDMEERQQNNQENEKDENVNDDNVQQVPIEEIVDQNIVNIKQDEQLVEDQNQNQTVTKDTKDDAQLEENEKE